MTQQIAQYKGYEVVGTRNKNILARIQNNKHHSNVNEIVDTKTGQRGRFNLSYIPPIEFVFTSYDTMVRFIDENPR